MTSGSDHDYMVMADGGVRSGRTYGSWVVYEATVDGYREVVRVAREPFGAGTNNTAEYEAATRGVQAAVDYLGREDLDPVDHRLLVRSDSMIVVHQVVGDWRIWKDHLVPYRDRILEVLGQFGGWDLEWVSRVEMVDVLGH